MFKKVSRYIFWLLLVIIAVFSLGEIISSTPEAVLKKLIRNGRLGSQSVNIRLNYLLVIPVGEARLDNLGEEKFKNEDFIHIRAQAKTFDYVKSIFYAKATVDSYIDPAELHSVYFLQRLEMINKPAEDKEIKYDQKKHIMTYRGPRGTEERVIDEHTQDPLSAFFYLENKKFAVGEEFNLGFNTNQKKYILRGRFIAKESVRVLGKDYQILIVEARVARKDKNPRHQTSFKVWFLDYEGRRVPLLFKAMTNIGPVVARVE